MREAEDGGAGGGGRGNAHDLFLAMLRVPLPSRDLDHLQKRSTRALAIINSQKATGVVSAHPKQNSLSAMSSNYVLCSTLATILI